MPIIMLRNFSLFILIAFATAILVQAQDSSPVQVDKYTAAIKVACIGDSITAGFGAGRGNSWPDQLRKALGANWEVRNFGISGTTLMQRGDSPYQKQSAFKAAKDLNPDVVVIMLGTNDTKPQNWINFQRDFEADYKNMAGQFAELPGKPRIFVCYPPYIAQGGSWGINDPNTLAEIPVIDRVAKDMKLGIIDVHGELKNKDSLIPDKVHPNEKGQTVIARTVLQALTGYNGDFPPIVVLLASSEKGGMTWRYTTEKPVDNWFKVDFDASSWKEGKGGFGSPVSAGNLVRTEWKTADIWLRREFSLENKRLNRPRLWMRHDDGAEVYINGVLAARAGRFNEEYRDFDIRPDAAATLRLGRNVIAVHCRQTGGGQFIDAGLIDTRPVTSASKK
ncbi:MAG: GDSL-type esterase/lipase family protein [Planctomycetota bacterium]